MHQTYDAHASSRLSPSGYRVRHTVGRGAAASLEGIYRDAADGDSGFELDGGFNRERGSIGRPFGAGPPSAAAGTKSFLERLFEDLEGNGEMTSTQNNGGVDKGILDSVVGHEPSFAINDPRLPAPSWPEQVRREACKPNILQFCVSTDAVPLLTTTAPMTYHSFDAARYVQSGDPVTTSGWTRKSGQREARFSGSHASVAMRRSRDAMTLITPQPQDGNGVAAPHGAFSAHAAPAGFGFYDEEAELRATHLHFLLSTVDRCKHRVKLQQLHHGTDVYGQGGATSADRWVRGWHRPPHAGGPTTL